MNRSNNEYKPSGLNQALFQKADSMSPPGLILLGVLFCFFSIISFFLLFLMMSLPSVLFFGFLTLATAIYGIALIVLGAGKAMNKQVDDWTIAKTVLCVVVLFFLLVTPGIFLLPFVIGLGIAWYMISSRRTAATSTGMQSVPASGKEPSGGIPKPPIPNMPAKKKQKVSVHPEYQRSLDILSGHIDEMNLRKRSVEVFLDDYFGGSAITKARYMSVIDNANRVLQINYEKATQAVSLFGTSSPTPGRIEILNRYVEDSSSIMTSFERVIDELIKVQQSDVLADGDLLDSLLENLVQTTTFYQKKQFKNAPPANPAVPGVQP